MSSDPVFEDFSRQWDAGQSEFILSTSGSTGMPKPFALLRDKIAWSCARTAEFLEIDPTDKIYCCLPTTKVSGFMQLARAKNWGIAIQVAQPASDPMLSYDPSAGCTLTSITPMQFYEILQNDESLEKFHTFKQVLIGGAEINFAHAQKLLPQIFHTYGMTETYSHIAFRRLTGKNKNYRTIHFTEIKTAEDGCLQIKNFLTDEQWLKTNDAVEILPDGSFMFLGRADIMINSGGLKINPEEVEYLIAQHFDLPPNAILCTGIPDARLGQKVVLQVLKKYRDLDWDMGFLPAELRPRDVVFVDAIPLTATGKLKRA